MGAFAAYLKRAGIRVTGSDQNIYPPMSDVLAQAQIELFTPYDPQNLNRILGEAGRVPDLVVVGNVISRTNPEMEALTQRGWKYVSLPEFMEQNLLPETTNLVVSGTHGKTTTSSMLAHVLMSAEVYPSYFIGGVSHTLPHSFHVETRTNPQGLATFVLEGDEYDTAFWDKVPKFNHYLPDRVILTSVEYDHADIYPNFEAVYRAFQGLIQRIRHQGQLIACVESESVRNLVQEALSRKDPIRVMTYGRGVGDYQLGHIEMQGELMCVSVLSHGEKIETLKLRLSGEHNALNAIAVYLMAKNLGLSSEQIAQGLLSFEGVKRRQEERGEVRGVLVIDDFAHHPTAVKETLKALKQKYPERRLITVFEPRSATSRRKVFQREYAVAFQASTRTFIAEAFDQSKIPAHEQFSSHELVQDLKARQQHAVVFSEVGVGVEEVAKEAQKGDVVAVLSNGGFNGFIPKLLEALKA